MTSKFFFLGTPDGDEGVYPHEPIADVLAVQLRQQIEQVIGDWLTSDLMIAQPFLEVRSTGELLVVLPLISSLAASASEMIQSDVGTYSQEERRILELIAAHKTIIRDYLWGVYRESQPEPDDLSWLG